MLKFGMNSGHKARTLRRTTWKVHTTNYQHRLHQLIVELMGPTLPFPAWFLVRRQWRLSSFNVTNDISHVKKVVSLCDKTDTAQLGGFGDSFAAFEVFLASFTLPCVVELLPTSRPLMCTESAYNGVWHPISLDPSQNPKRKAKKYEGPYCWLVPILSW